MRPAAPSPPGVRGRAFRSASLDRFWISVRTDDPDQASEDLLAAGATELSVVEDAS
jgi:hypothetical protein